MQKPSGTHCAANAKLRKEMPRSFPGDKGHFPPPLKFARLTALAWRYVSMRFPFFWEEKETQNKNKKFKSGSENPALSDGFEI